MIPSQLPDVRSVIAFDTESSGLFADDGARVSAASVAWYEGDRRVSYAFPFWQDLHGKPEYNPAKHGQLGPNPNLPPDEWDALVRWLTTRPAGLAMHNAIHDIAITRFGPPPDCEGVDLIDHLFWETMLGQRILDPEHPLALKATGERVFGIPPDEQKALKSHLRKRKMPIRRYDLAAWEVMEPYAAEDTDLTIQLARHQWHRFNNAEAPMSRVRYEIDQVLRTLWEMEKRGIPYRKELSLAWADKIDADAGSRLQALPFGDTPAQVRTYFFSPADQGGLGLKPIKMTAGGKTAPVASVDAEVMRTLAGQDAPHAKDYQQYKALKDASARYYRGYANAVGPDGRLRTRFRQTGTRTGRLSCERTNLQAVPHDHRLLASGAEVLAQAPSPWDLIAPDDGWELWTLDLAQAELRVAALYAKCQAMLDIIAANRDPHGETATSLWHITPDDPAWDVYRGVGKRANFSLIFGIGPDRFRDDTWSQTGVDLGQGATRKLHRDWHKLYPEFKAAINIYMRLAERDGYTHIRDGIRRYYSEIEVATHDQHKAFSSKVQGNLGYFGRAWMVKVNEFVKQHVDPAHGLLLQVHDAVYLELPQDAGQQLAGQCADIGRQLWERWFPGVPGDVDTKRVH